MEKEFIPENLVEKLKELGYNGPIIISYILFGEYKPKVDIIQRITFSQAFRWFREKYKFDLTIQHNKKYVAIVYSSVKNFSIDEYETYEEAELACLNKLIEIVEPELN